MTAKRISILHIVLNVHEGGLERMLGDLLRRMDRDRFHSHVLALEFLGRLSAGLDQVADLEVCPPMTKGSLFWPRAIIGAIRRIRPDVVHMHTGVWYKGSLAARMAGVASLVYTEHGRTVEDPFQDRLMDGWAAGRTDIVVPVSDLLAQQLAAGIVRDPSKIRTIPNGIDTSAFRPSEDRGRLRAELEVDEGAPIIGSIGRLAPIKGFDIMIEAFARLRAQRTTTPAPVLVIAGGGPDMAALRGQVAGHGLSDQVHLLGWRDDVHNLHAAFDLYTMASRSEGTSIGLLEAMSAGLCPVVTNVGGNASLLGPELAHRLCPPEDPESLAHAWAEALATADRGAEGAIARARVVEHFSLDTMVSEYASLYEELYSGAREPA